MPDSKSKSAKVIKSRSFYYAAALIIIAAVFSLGLYIGRLSLRQDELNFTVIADKPSQTVYNRVETEKINNNIKININTATKDELVNLKGIGEVLADKIIAYRNENGGFRYTYEIMDVEGVGETKFKAIKDYITVK